MKIPNFYFRNNMNVSAYADESIEIELCGVAFLLCDGHLTTDVLQIAHMILNKTIDYNKLHGAFRLAIHNKKDDSYAFLGDNSSSQFFFLDKYRNLVSDSFLALVDARSADLEPDCVAVSQFLRYSTILSEATLVKGIERLSMDSCLIVSGGTFFEFSKNLSLFCETTSRTSLSELMNAYCRALDEQAICSVCTGGTDSRTVLAHLIANGCSPQLVLTGHEGNPDLPVAKEISSVVRLPLKILNPENRSTDWLEKGYYLCDGVYDTILSYRHWLKADWARQEGFAFEFGGVGGEFYKNAFFPGILRLVFQKTNSVPLWFGEALKAMQREEYESLMSMVQKNNHGTLLCRFNSIGFVKISHGFSVITNGYSAYLVKIDPLVDRDIVGGVCGDSVFTHSMQIWQRRQIASVCPTLSDIPTDQGRSCSVKRSVIFIERIRETSKYASLVIRRIKRKLKLNSEGSRSYWDDDYVEASKTDTYIHALEKCRELGLIAEDISNDEIPLNVRGLIITLGLVFRNLGRCQ